VSGEQEQPNDVGFPDAGGITVDFHGTSWTRVMNWDFSDGQYPGGWGWGDWRIENGLLTGYDPEGNIAVYFFPYTHGDNVILETKARLIGYPGNGHPEMQMLTRDDRAIHSESGIVLRAGENRVDIRHMVGTTQYIHETFPTEDLISLDQWYVIRFIFRDGKIDAFLDGEHVFSSDRYAMEIGTRDRVGGVYPVAMYNEPHLAVRHGGVQFAYVKIFMNGCETSAFTASERSPDLPDSAGAAKRHWLLTVVIWLFCAVIFLVCAYAIRHYVFTLNRLFGRQRQPYLDVDTAEWPEVTVIIPAHNEEVVIGEILEALLEVDYPGGRLTVFPVNDRSKDKTGYIIDDFARSYPDRILPYHRRSGTTGKAAVLNDALEKVETEIVLIFDADYVPGRGLIKQLVAPFFDPEVGAVMGRVVPYNVGSNLLTRLLDLERAGGYQVNQQARMNLKMVPQYGGTVGGVRKSALMSVGGWREDSLAEDTDATYRLLLGGWKTVYQNRSECYEQVPETWKSRIRQIMRWAKGHNQATVHFSLSMIRNHRTRWIEKLDGILLLGVYVISPLLLLGSLMGIILWFLGEPHAALLYILLVTPYSTLGNFAIFYEITAAAQLDGGGERIRLLPFIFFGFLISLFSVSRAAFAQVGVNGNNNHNGSNNEVVWDKTERTSSFNGYANGNMSNGSTGQTDDPDRSTGRRMAGTDARSLTGDEKTYREMDVVKNVVDVSIHLDEDRGDEGYEDFNRWFDGIRKKRDDVENGR
jgi:cellulose synthase/poly-beta-1,6-N-acetylglucosamine synthase-like glycosyltransferase